MLIALARLRPPPPQEKSLERYLSDREARDDEPWRREARKAEVQLESFSRGFAEEGAMEGLRRDFLSGAKAGLFSEEGALCLSYLLCSASSPARAVYDLSCLLLRVPPASRTQTHNWHVAGLMSKARREASGRAIATLPWPLFFDGGGFETLNSKLLSLGVGVSGGGSEKPVFAERRLLEGSGALRILGPDGSQTALLETGPLEQALADLKAAVLGRGRGRGRGSRGRGRGRSRGGPWQGGGQETEDPKN